MINQLGAPMIALSRFFNGLALASIFALLVCNDALSTKMLDSSRYFSNPEAAALADAVQNGDAYRVVYVRFFGTHQQVDEIASQTIWE